MRAIMAAATLVTQVILLSCDDSYETVSKAEANPGFYASQSSCTDPGDLVWVFEDVPTSYEAICSLIKKQFIHPLEVGPFRDVLPENRCFEDTVYQSVWTMLSGLLEHDSTGLAIQREPQNRLVVACLHHSLLFASILRERGTPVRIRVGFAPYIGQMVGKDVNISHVVCEVWNDAESRWMYIDPDRHMVDFASEEFITGAEAWLMLRADELEVRKFRSAFFVEERSILDMLRLDLLYGLREEVMYWGDGGAPNIPQINELSDADLRALDGIAQLLEHAGSNAMELGRLRESVEFLK